MGMEVEAYPGPNYCFFTVVSVHPFIRDEYFRCSYCVQLPQGEWVQSLYWTTRLDYWTHPNCKINVVQYRIEARHTYLFISTMNFNHRHT